MIINASYFVGEINIPNTDSGPILERVNFFIQKYEPEFLTDLLGYPLYKAFITGISVVPPAVPASRFTDIIFGAEYTDRNGIPRKWKGLVVTNSPVYALSGSYSYKAPIYMQAGVTAGLTPGNNVAVFDGTNGTVDLRGWTPIIFRLAIMKPGIDYSWDSTTGTLTLLVAGDKFGANEFFSFQFELALQTVIPTSSANGTSLIANYIWYWYARTAATQSTGIGEVIASAENSTNASPRKKLASAWNEMNDWMEEFVWFMDSKMISDPTVYAEWTYQTSCEAKRKYAFINPIF